MLKVVGIMSLEEEWRAPRPPASGSVVEMAGRRTGPMQEVAGDDECGWAQKRTQRRVSQGGRERRSSSERRRRLTLTSWKQASAAAPSSRARVAAPRGGIDPPDPLRPVRPLWPAWLLSTALVLVCAAVSFVGAARVGLFGFAKMDSIERVFILFTLATLLTLFARALVAEMVPASLSASVIR